MSAVTEFRWMPEDPKSEDPKPEDPKTGNPRTDWRPLFEKAPVGLAQCHRSGTITAMNPELQRRLNAGPKTERPAYFKDLVHPHDRSAAERLLRELFEGERDSFQIDCPAISESEAEAMRWTAWRVPGRNGDPDYVLALAERIPEDREAVQRIRQAGRLEAVGRLAGGVAHDFNNLLTGVLLYCDLLMANLEPGNRVRKYAEEIRSAGMQATGLVRQLLSVARPTKYEPRLLSLNEITECMRNLLLRLIGENIELKFHLDPALGLIEMDPTQAQQILLNLVLNARDAMPGGGEITIETRNCKVQVLNDPGQETHAASLPCALFAVGDNGSGIDEAARTHLFEAFFTTKAGKGTGLGLATVHDIVTSNGGLIYVDSLPGRGTRFTVLLPLVPEAQSFQQPGNPEKTEGAIQQFEEE
jgi:two-component system cell cycle sensor histidine kinase/response regulator CckA